MKTVNICGMEVDTPGHICAFFSSDDEAYDTLIPYFKEGVDGGAVVVNVLDQARHADHRARLAAAGLGTGEGGIELASSEETYLAGGEFNMEQMVDFVQDRLSSAASEGRYVRTAGWMDWLHRHPLAIDRALEYEARMNLLVPTFDCTFLCVYDLSHLDGQTVVDIMATHPYVVLKGKIHANAFYIPPQTYLAELLTRRTGARLSPQH